MSGDILTVLITMLGAIRVSTPFIFVALGDCLTEKSGRVNLGLEGTPVLGARVGYAASYHSGNPWVGVSAAGLAGAALGACTARFAASPGSTTSPSASPRCCSVSASPSSWASPTSDSGVIIDDTRALKLLLSQDASVDAGRVLGAWRHRHPCLRRSEGRKARTHHLPRWHVSREGA